MHLYRLIPRNKHFYVVQVCAQTITINAERKRSTMAESLLLRQSLALGIETVVMEKVSSQFY
jgi:hypothetical protein